MVRSSSAELPLILSLAHLLRVEKPPRPESYTRIHLQLLATVTGLLKTEPLEDRVKLCFVIGEPLVQCPIITSTE